jgi:aspartate 1-decarboxylase
MDAADLLPCERVMVYNITNGERFDTYIITGDRGSGTVCVNGAAARKVNIGDLIIIASYAGYSEEELRSGASRLIMVDGKNSITETRIEHWARQ